MYEKSNENDRTPGSKRNARRIHDRLRHTGKHRVQRRRSEGKDHRRTAGTTGYIYAGDVEDAKVEPYNKVQTQCRH